MSKTAILYIRVSTDEQADKGYSLRYQEERLLKYCELQNIKVVSLFQEDHSAKSFERPEFTKLLTLLRKNRGEANLLLFTKWDRFSRNAGDAYAMINQLNRLGAEPQAIEQPLDLDIPENKIMLAFYLASPEVENDRRALNTFVGMRRAKKEGRWVSTAPKGYKNTRNERDRKVITPSEDAPMVKWVFEELAKGCTTITDVMKMAREKGFKCSKSQFFRMLNNPVYCGRIILPKYKEEVEEWIKGSHEPIISEHTFYEVQDLLKGRRKNIPSKNTRKEELPLRGFLLCPKCGGNLTGSASHGRSSKYFYYHCHPPRCNERVKAAEANKEFLKLIEITNVTQEGFKVYGEIVEQIFRENHSDKSHRTKKIKEEISKHNQRVNKAQQMMLDNAIGLDEYREIKSKTQPEIDRLTREFMQLSVTDSEYKHYCDEGTNVVQHLTKVYTDADVIIKQKLIGSIIMEKLVFENGNYRTAQLNPAISLIFPELSDFRASENETGGKNSPQFHIVPGTRIELVRAYKAHRILSPACLPVPPPGQKHI